MEFVSYDIASNDFRRAGAASRSIKEHLKRIGADAEAIRRTMIAAYEAEMNVVIHSVGGRLEASLTDSQIDVNVVDDGPGIPDVEQAMVEGYSTASAEARALGFGAGLGLPNIRRNSDRLRVTSRVDEGTRVSFTVYLKPESTSAARLISLYASADRCRDCRACLTACPTQAMRVREGRPSVLEHLCVDCADCIAACDSRALAMRDEFASLDDLADKEKMLLVVPPALLAGCGAEYPPSRVLAALRELGFADVVTTEPFEEALREAAVMMTGEPADEPAGGASGAASDEGDRFAAPGGANGAGQLGAGSPAAAAAAEPGGAPRPVPGRLVIVPSCPAIVNLIELRFPSLVPQLAPFDSPWEAVQATYGDRPVAYVVSCPSQRSALLSFPHPLAQAEYVAPEVIRQAVMIKLTGGGVSSDGAPEGRPAVAGAAAPAGPADAGAKVPARAGPANDAGAATVGAVSASAAHSPVDPGQVLTVTGMDHVIAVLEEVENGLLDDVSVIEPFACEGGCFGSPLLFEDYHVAARRWSQGRAAVEAAPADAGGASAVGAAVQPGVAPSGAFAGVAGGPARLRAVTAVARRRPFVARPGIRLDPDMGLAIKKLARLQAVIHSLPGRDCGTCGAPTCAALAEDVVMGRAGLELCPYVATLTS